MRVSSQQVESMTCSNEIGRQGSYDDYHFKGSKEYFPFFGIALSRVFSRHSGFLPPQKIES